jgi:hypothetical protein
MTTKLISRMGRLANLKEPCESWSTLKIPEKQKLLQRQLRAFPRLDSREDKVIIRFPKAQAHLAPIFKYKAHPKAWSVTHKQSTKPSGNLKCGREPKKQSLKHI